MYSLYGASVPALLLPTGHDPVVAFLAGNLGKATVILLAAFATTWLMRRASASLRHLVWSATVAILALLPLASFVLPNWYVALPAGVESPWPVAAAASTESNGTAAVLTPATAPNPTGEAAGEFAPTALPAILIGAWALGFCLVAARLWIGVRRVRQMARGARALEANDWIQASAQLAAALALRRPVALLRSERVSIPMTAGVRRPVILLPDDAEGWTAERRWVVLAHELLHVRRGDYAFWMVAQLACALYWFHPLVWLAASRLRKEAEQACDDGVLRLGAAAPAYAEHLVSLARGWSLARTAELSAMAMAQSSHLESRIRALLDPTRNRGDVSGRSRLWIAVAAVLVLAPLAAVRAPAQEASASIQGTVNDPSGARLPGAFLTLRRASDQSKAVTATNDAGEFAFAPLPAGDYVLEVREPGFQIQQQSVKLSSGAHQSLDITVNMGSVAEEIVVVGKSSAPGEQPRPSGPPRRIRVGGNVQRSKLITQVRPIYPEDLKREGVQGLVVLDAVILTDGSLGNLRLANNLVEVDQRLVDAAMEAVRFWRYEPTLLNGVPVEIVTTITVSFRLEP
jgi:TonB family protein